MGIATDMKNLTQDIVGSYDVRMEFEARRVRESQKENEERAKDVGNMLKGFHKAHEEMADELREGLAKGEATRLKEHAGMMKGIQTRQKERERETAEMVKGFQKGNEEREGEVKGMLSAFHDEREKMAAEWQNLTSMMANRRSGRYKPKPKGEMGGSVATAEEAMEPTKKKGRRRRKG